MPYLQRALASQLLMSNLYGFALAMAALVVAWRRKQRPESAARWIAVAGGLLAFTLSLDPFLHRWDERFHAVVARNMLRHPFRPTLYDDPVLPAGTNWQDCQVWLHKPPLTLFLMAASFWLTGVCELSARLPSILLFAAATFGVFRIGAMSLGNRIGLLAAALYATHAQVLALASGRTPTDHADSIFGSIIVLGIWAAMVQARRGGFALSVLVGVLTGLAILTKWLPGLLILGVWGIHAIGKRPVRTLVAECGLAVAACLAVAAPWQVYIRWRFPVEAEREAAFTLHHLNEVIEGHGEPWWFQSSNIPFLFGPLAVVAIAWFVWKAARERNREAVALSVWLIVIYVFFALPRTKMLNYTMPAAPALILMIAAGFDRLRTLWRETDRRAIRAAVALAWALTLGWQVGRFLDVWSPHDPHRAAVEQAARFRALAEQHRGERAAYFGTESRIEAMFYLDGPVYSGSPTPEQTKEIESKGYRIVNLDRAF